MRRRMPENGPLASSFGAVAPYYDYLMRHVPYRHWADWVDRLFLRLRAEPEWVLDLCCGTGRFGIELARRGYRVLGCDLSLPMVEAVAANAREAGVFLPAAVADATRLPFVASFDAIVSVFDSLNNIVRREGLAEALECCATALRPGGWLVFDLNTLRSLEEELFTQRRNYPSELLHYDWVSRWDPETRLSTIEMDFEWREVDPPRRFHETHVQRGWGNGEVIELLNAVGLRVEGAYDAYSFAQATERSTRAVFVARRPSR